MDSEDEKFLDRIDEELASEHCWLYKLVESTGPDMRINENYEKELLRLIAPLFAHEQNVTAHAELFSKYRPLFTQYRFQRLCKTLQGFHTGYLDLSGRHQARYVSLLTRWTDFIRGMERISSVLLPPKPPYSASLADEKDDDLLHIKPGSEDLVRAFGKKWRFEAMSKSMILYISGLFRQVMATLKQSPHPVFQKMCLTDLPSELLHIIVRSTDHNEARLLGSTCKLLRDISRFYIYRRRALSLKSIGWTRLPEDANAKRQAALDRVLAAKDRLLNQMRSMLDSDDPRLIQDIESLWVGGGFHRDSLILAEIEEDFELRRQHYEPLLDVLRTIILKATKIEKLTISTWDLSADIVPAVLSLPHLHTIVILDCRVFPGPIQPEPLPSSILNAHISVKDLEDLGAWVLFAGMPKLRVLSIASMSQPDSPLCPPPSVRTIINPFKTIERFAVSMPCPEEVSDLIDWMRLARQSIGRLRLTHFKFDGGPDGIAEVPLFELLHVLRGAPMLRLSLDGIYNADPSLLWLIGQYFPRLESLAIHYRQSYRQTRSEPARWPAPSWEYAIMLRAFPHLKHFIWNQWTNIFEPQTRVLEFMERDWQDMTFEEMREATDSYDDWECVARLFAVYGPSLETFTYVSRFPRHHYIITRTAAGIQVAPSSCTNAGPSFWELFEELDPYDYPVSWPHVYSPSPNPTS